MQPITREALRALAAANGLTIPDDRLPLVLREYESLMRTVNDLNRLSLPREAEPATTFSLAPAPARAGVRG